MPFWCGYWGTAWTGFCWLLPLVGLVVMGVMVFTCTRGFGCLRGRAWSDPGDVTELRREIQHLKAEVEKLLRHPN